MIINDLYICNNLTYILVDFCKLKDKNNEWIDGVIYKLYETNNPLSVLSLDEFKSKFKKINNNKLILKKSKVNTYPDELVVLLHIKEKNYLVVHTVFRYDEDELYSIGEYIELDDLEVEDIDFDITKTQIYNDFLFQEYLNNLND